MTARAATGNSRAARRHAARGGRPRSWNEVDPEQPHFWIVDRFNGSATIYINRAWTLREAQEERLDLLRPYRERHLWRRRLRVYWDPDRAATPHATGLSARALEVDDLLAEGLRFRRRRLAVGLKVADLARMAGVSQGSVSHHEGGLFARPSTLERIEAALRAVEAEHRERGASGGLPASAMPQRTITRAASRVPRGRGPSRQRAASEQ